MNPVDVCFLRNEDVVAGLLKLENAG